MMLVGCDVEAWGGGETHVMGSVKGRKGYGRVVGRKND